MSGSTVAGPAPIVIPAQGKQTATLIFFHGLGDQGHGWAEMFRHEVNLPHLKGVCPNAANRPVTLNFGMIMPAWYDLLGLSENAPEDTTGIQNATNYVHSLIEAEIAAGIPSERIIIGGFSMGGALALYAGLTYDKKLGGIVGLSSFLLQRDKIPGGHKANLQTPIFLGHGTQDSLVPFDIGQRTKDALSKFNSNVVLKSYPIDHTTFSTELKDLKEFVQKNVA